MKMCEISNRRAQALVALLLGLAAVLLMFVFIFYNRYRESTWLLKHAMDNEEAFFAAEGAVEEAIARIRQGANDPRSMFYDFLRKAGDRNLSLDLPHSKNLLMSTFSNRFKKVDAWIKVCDVTPVPGHLVADSADRTGHVCVSATAEIGAGRSTVSETLQIRILDMAIPAPLSHYDIVFNLDDSMIGANWLKDGNTELSRLPLDEIRVINRDWHYNLLENQQLVEYNSVPFVLGRVCRHFQTWQQMYDYLSWGDNDLYFCGDVLSADQSSLRMENVNLHGFGQIFSFRSSINLSGIKTGKDSQLLFSILQKGDITLSRIFEPENTRLSFLLPRGQLNIAKDSGFKGFAFIQGENMPESKERFLPDPSLKVQKTMVAISGQTMIWKNEKN